MQRYDNIAPESDQRARPPRRRGRPGPPGRRPRRRALEEGTLDDAREQALLERARAGDVAAFEELIRPELGRAYATAARLAGRQEAEDLVQEAALRAFRSLGGFRGGCRFGTWLYRIVVHLCADHARRQGRRAGLVEPLEAETAEPRPRGTAGDPEAELLAAERHRLVEAALASLPPGYRLVVLLRDVEGLSYEEVAELAGLPLGTVKSRVFRARRLLRQRLAGAGLLPSVPRGRGVAE
ncbi:MAG: sigma-70 family RNA polymerase sigma factor [Clostridia bacterium]|nr:sigma-70 family RNA polymerase sigma factor [Clostridia bacterium]